MNFSNRRRAMPVAAMLVVFLPVLLSTGCDDKIERQLGKMSASSIEREYRVVDDPLLAEWVDLAGHTMLGYTTRQSIPYEFKVIETDMVNAFAAPYGHIYVTTGLLDFADSEDEIWGVVGHEIGHVVHRHSMSQAKRSFLYNIGLMILGGSNETMAEIAGLGLGLLSLRYSRDNEYEADDMGRRLSFAANYDPAGNIQFFDKLMAKYQKKRPSSIEVMFLTHPPTTDRIKRQMAMAELSEENPESLLRIGRGYARRQQNRRAETYLVKAAELSPKDPTTILTLGDVQMARGEYEDAAASYQTASNLQASPYAARGIQLAATQRPAGLAPATPAERGWAGGMLASARDASRKGGIIVAQSKNRGDAVSVAAAPAIDGAHSVINGLFGLSGSQPDLSDSTQSIVTFANAAVNSAIEPVYSVERQRESLLESAAAIQEVTTETIAKLESAVAGAVPGVDIQVLQRTLAENELALADIQTALRELEQAQPLVSAAAQSATETTRYIERIMKGDQTTATAQAAQNSGQLTQSHALKATAATKKATKVSRRAKLRALLARMNTAAVGASPELRESLDGMVAHFVLETPRSVRQLRTQGLGYGDAALLIAASRSVKSSPSQLARSAKRAKSMVDHVESIGGRSDAALVLMKYLANALEYETES